MAHAVCGPPLWISSLRTPASQSVSLAALSTTHPSGHQVLLPAVCSSDFFFASLRVIGCRGDDTRRVSATTVTPLDLAPLEHYVVRDAVAK